MSHQIAYAITDRLPAEILDGDRIQAPAPGGNQHPPERIILGLQDIAYNFTDGGASIAGNAAIVIPNPWPVDALRAIGQELIRLADEAASRATPAADEAPAKKGRKKSQDTETPAE